MLITTDQERWHATDPAPLPAHDRLRAAGTSFDRFYAGSVACSPARSVIYTGQHVTTTGVVDNIGSLQPSMTIEIPTLGHRLREAGYVTAYKGKWHLSSESVRSGGGDTASFSDVLEPYGFGDYTDAGDNPGLPYEGFLHDQEIAADAARWLQTRGRRAAAAGTPFLLAVNLVNPHDIMFGTEDRAFVESNADRHEAMSFEPFTGVPQVEIYEASWNIPTDPTWQQPTADPSRPSAHHEYAIAMPMVIGYGGRTTAELRRLRDYYINCLRDVDRAVSVVLDAIDASGLGDETVVVYTSDHGEMAGAHGLFGKGPFAYDENIRLPLIVVDPDRPGGRTCSALASQVDLVPTIYSLATGTEISHETHLPGTDLTSAAAEASNGGRDAVLFVSDGLTFLDAAWTVDTWAGSAVTTASPPCDLSKRGVLRTIVTRSHKFTRYHSPREYHDPESMEELKSRNSLELFDLEADPHEMLNLAHDPDGQADLLIADLNQQLRELIASEIGEDSGSWTPDLDAHRWTSKDN